MERGSPYPIPLLITMGSNMYPSNFSMVILLVSILLIKLVILLGTLHFYRLCSSHARTAFGNVPSMSKNSMAVTAQCTTMPLSCSPRGA
jgi:hypothetical protein